MTSIDHRDPQDPDIKKFRDWEGKRTGKFSYGRNGWTLSVLNGVTTQLSKDGITHWFKTEADAQTFADNN